MSKKQKRSSTTPGFRYVRSHQYVTEYALIRNGLSVLCVTVPGAPTVTTNIVYHIGSQYEGPGETGITHMLEHMLFKPTFTKSITWEDLERRGARMNATTWLDRTMYYFNLPATHLSDMLAVEADRMRNLAITTKEFFPERTNVLSEYEMYNSMPAAALEWLVMQAAFVNHGYHHDTIGYRHDIEEYTTEQLQHFYDTYYWPNNATLIVSGDLPHATLLAYVKKHFGMIPHSPEPIPRTIQPEMKQEGQRRVTLQRETPLRICQMSFKSPAFTHRDWIPLQLALDYLTDGSTSPLYKKLVAAGLATDVSASLYPTKDPFLASIVVHATKHAAYADIESIVQSEINTLAQKPIPAAQFRGIKTAAYTSELCSRDGTFAIAQNLAEYVAAGDWTHFFTLPDAIQKTTAKQVSTAAETYLRPSQVTIGTIGT